MYKIIICAEDLFIRIGIAHSLFWEKYGYSIMTTVRSEEELYNEVAIKKPDLIIMDLETLKIPLKNFCDILKDFNGNIECIGIGKQASEATIKTYLMDGLLGYISKEGLTREKFLVKVQEYHEMLRIKSKEKLPVTIKTDRELITAAKANTLKELLYGTKQSGLEWNKERLKRYHLELEHPNYFVIMTKLTPMEKDQDLEKVEMIDTTHDDDIETTISGGVVYKCFSGVDEISFICNFKDEGYGAQECMIRDITQKITADMIRAYGIQPVLYISRQLTTLKGICMGYRECLETYEQMKKQDLSTSFIFCEEKQKQEYNRYVTMIKGYIERNYRQEMSMTQIAEEVGLTVSYMSTLFKRAVGQTYKDYVIDYRLEKAKQKLRQTTESIRDIASSVGYDNAHYFSKLFKEKVGMTPSEYRNKYYT